MSDTAMISQTPIPLNKSTPSIMSELTVIQIKDNTANPAPLGLLGFGMTTVLLNMHNAGFYELNAMILAMGICYGGIAQVIAGVMEWKKGNTFAATAFISYGLLLAVTGDADCFAKIESDRAGE